MSPLVRSLFALAALFATAATLPPSIPRSCTQETIGKVTPFPVEVTVPSSSGTIDIKDECPSGYRRVGETVTACNNDPNGQPPLVSLAYPPDLEYVKVECPDDCPDGVTVAVTEYCEIAIGISL